MADALFALLCGSTDRGAVTGKSQVPGINQPPVDGLVQELLVIKPENEEKGILRRNYSEPPLFKDEIRMT